MKRNKPDSIITGIKVETQMNKAKEILINQVIPRETLFQERKKNGSLTKKFNNSNNNARFDNHSGM